MCSDWSAAQKALRCESGKGFKSVSFAYSVSGMLDFPTVDWEYFQDGPHDRSSIYTWLSMQQRACHPTSEPAHHRKNQPANIICIFRSQRAPRFKKRRHHRAVHVVLGLTLSGSSDHNKYPNKQTNRPHSRFTLSSSPWPLKTGTFIFMFRAPKLTCQDLCSIMTVGKVHQQTIILFLYHIGKLSPKKNLQNLSIGNKNFPTIMSYRYSVFSHFEFHIRQEMKWNSSILTSTSSCYVRHNKFK